MTMGAKLHFFVEQLNQVFNEFSLQLTIVEPISSPKKGYTSEKLMYSFANKPVSTYDSQKGLSDIGED